MPTKPVEMSVLQEALDGLARAAGNTTHAAAALGVGRACLQHRIALAKRHGLMPGPGLGQLPSPPRGGVQRQPDATPEERREIIRLRAEVASLRRDRADTDGQAMLAQAITDARGRMQAEAIEPPRWTARPDGGKDSAGIPTLMLTDWHVGETVRAAEVFNQNRFDEATADARVRQCIERAVMLAEMHAPAGGHKGGVVFLGGDFVSGWLHEELVRTDWCSPLQSAAWCVSRLVWALRALRDAWGRIYVVGVPGNHGRMTHKPPGKGHAFQSFDWLIYTMVAQRLAESAADKKTITISVPDDGEQIVPVAGTRYHLLHGHQLGVKGGDGIIGALGPITRGAVKVGGANRSLGRDADVMVIGHYHTTLWLPKVIVGGTLKGYDEYARVSRFTYEPASQLLWFSHAKWGPNSPLRVFLQEPLRRPSAECVMRTKA